MLTISDTGHGMTPDVLKHAMEPLFTTKGLGKGTVLGLATVYGIVRQSGGFISIDSTVGKGTSVQLNFPKAEPGPIASGARPATKEVPLGDGELILVVEDNDGRVLSEEEISTELIEMGDLLKVELLLHITKIGREKWVQRALNG